MFLFYQLGIILDCEEQRHLNSGFKKIRSSVFLVYDNYGGRCSNGDLANLGESRDPASLSLSTQPSLAWICHFRITNWLILFKYSISAPDREKWTSKGQVGLPPISPASHVLPWKLHLPILTSHVSS